MNKIIHLFLIFLFFCSINNTTMAQQIYIEGSITNLRMDGTNSDCSSNPDPRIYAQVSVSSAAWSNQWSFSTDNVSSGTNGNCGMTCNAGSCGSCGFGVAYSGNANWSTTQTLPQNWQVNLYGYEDDGGCPFDSNDGDCYSYSMVNNTNVLSYGNPNCTGGYYTGSNFRDCTSDGTTYRYTADWRFRYYFVGLTDANAGGTPSGPDKLCAGSTASFTITEPLSGRYNSVNWQLNGTDVSGATGASYTSGVLNAGLYTFRRRSVYCTDFFQWYHHGIFQRLQCSRIPGGTDHNGNSQFMWSDVRTPNGSCCNRIYGAVQPGRRWVDNQPFYHHTGMSYH